MARALSNQLTTPDAFQIFDRKKTQILIVDVVVVVVVVAVVVVIVVVAIVVVVVVMVVVVNLKSVESSTVDVSSLKD